MGLTEQELEVDETLLWALLRNPVGQDERLIEWASRWNDAALLFFDCESVEFATEDTDRTLELTWEPISETMSTLTAPRYATRDVMRLRLTGACGRCTTASFQRRRMLRELIRRLKA